MCQARGRAAAGKWFGSKVGEHLPVYHRILRIHVFSCIYIYIVYLPTWMVDFYGKCR